MHTFLRTLRMRSNLSKAYIIISRMKLPGLQNKDVANQSTYASLFNVGVFQGKKEKSAPSIPHFHLITVHSSARQGSMEIQMMTFIHKWNLPWLHFGLGWGGTGRDEGAPSLCNASTEPQRLLKSLTNGQRSMFSAIVVDLRHSLSCSPGKPETNIRWEDAVITGLCATTLV